MYSALMNFLYSTENKPLYFPVICKVLKKIQYIHAAESFLSLLLGSLGVPESQKGLAFLQEAAQRFPVRLKVPAVGKQLFYVLFMTLLPLRTAPVKFSRFSAVQKRNKSVADWSTMIFGKWWEGGDGNQTRKEDAILRGLAVCSCWPVCFNSSQCLKFLDLCAASPAAPESTKSFHTCIKTDRKSVV